MERDLNQYAKKNHWIPVEISLPDNGRLVQIQTEETWKQSLIFLGLIQKVSREFMIKYKGE